MTLATMQDVVTELRRRGIDAHLEYPGSISTTSNADVPSPIWWGDMNETVMGDVMDDDMEVIETIDSTLASDSTDVQAIANHIACHSFSGYEYCECGRRVGQCATDDGAEDHDDR